MKLRNAEWRRHPGITDQGRVFQTEGGACAAPYSEACSASRGRRKPVAGGKNGEESHRGRQGPRWRAGGLF